MRKLNNKKLNSKQLSLLLASSIALTSLAGCSKTITEETTQIPTVTTTVEPTVEPTVKPVATATPTPAEVSKDVATKEYMTRAKAVAEVMYEANKAYFDEKDYTAEDLENVYYVINSKYYDNENNLIMEAPELERSLDIIRELVEPQRIIELTQKRKDVDKGYLSLNDYKDEVNASVLYDYSAGLHNFIDVNENNKDLIDLTKAYSIEMIKVTENVKNGVSYEDHLTDFFGVIRSAQTGDLTDYSNIKNYFQNETTNPGYTYLAAAIYLAPANLLNASIDGEYITVPTKAGEENVKISYTYDEAELVYALEGGYLVETEDIIKAVDLRAELYQTMPIDVMCNAEVSLYNNYHTQPVKGKTKSL